MANSLRQIDPRNWIGDGSDNGSKISVQPLHNASGAIISLASGEKGTPFNVRLDDPSKILTKGDSLYFEARLSDDIVGNLAVGFVTRREFQPGTKIKGMFFNGENTTNGKSVNGTMDGFGPRPLKAGDTVSAYFQRLKSACKVIIYLNGRCLGEAFHVKTLGAPTFYPCLQILDGKGTVQVVVPSTLPTNIRREKAPREDAYNGEWWVKQAFTGPELGELPLPSEVLVTFASQDAAPSNSCRHSIQVDSTSKSYQLSIKVDKTSFNTTLHLEGKLENFDQIKEIGPAERTLPAAKQEDDFNPDDDGGKLGRRIGRTKERLKTEKDPTVRKQLEEELAQNRNRVAENYRKQKKKEEEEAKKKKAAEKKEDKPVETFILKALDKGGFAKMIVESETLIMSGPTAEMICDRYEKEFAPADSYQ